MIRQFLYLLSVVLRFLVPSLQAQEQLYEENEDEPMIVNSGEAQYDGKEISLVGQVAVQHSLGQISAHRLSVKHARDKDKKSKFAFLTIRDNVELKLHDGGQLSCQEAEIDYTKLQGIFFGNAEFPDVVYLNSGEKKANSQEASPCLIVKSDQMIVDLMREAATLPKSKSTKTFVKQIQAIHHVRIHYNQEYLLIADRALYQRLPSDNPSSIAGLLTLAVHGDHPYCQMTNLQGDYIRSQRIQISTVERRLWLDHPKGMLCMRREAHPSQSLEFTANELIWDDQEQTMQLRGQVHIIQNGTLHIRTEKEISITQAIIEGKKTLHSIKAPEKIEISYQDVQKGLLHKINCPGYLFIDHERQEIILQSLPEVPGQIGENRQVYVEDTLGEMYADRIHMNYQWENQQFTPIKIVLEGNVRLINRFDGHMQESGSVLHYAIADEMNYLPKEEEMILISRQGNRVLFFDKVNNVQMSAPSLKILRDVTTQKESIQGLGDVRFTFMERELDQLKQHFRLQESFP